MTADGLERYLSPALLEMLGDAVTVISPQWQYLYVSDGAARIIGKPAEEVVGADVWEVFPHVVGTPQYDACLRAMASRERERFVWFFETVNGWFEQHALPVADGLVVLVNDITEQRLSEWRAEQLVVIGEALAGTTTPQQINAVVCEHALTLVGAAGGALVLADEQHDVMRAVGWSGMDDELVARWAQYPLTTRTPGVQAYRTGEAVYVTSLLDGQEHYPEIARDLLRMDRHTLAALPLVSGGTSLGALIANFDTTRELSVGDKQFLTTTAAMAAQAVLRARLLAAEQDSIAALQRSLLPRTLPQPPGAGLAARYTAADGTTEVGGDWYDVVDLPDGLVGLVMGDVEGHDLQAAAVMGMVRSAVRASALGGSPPSVVLDDANRFLASLALNRIVTVAYVQLHAQEREVVSACAGHVPGQRVEPGAAPSELPTVVGPPLGVWEGSGHWPETRTRLAAGTAFALFTDGLVELRGEDIDRGLERVRATLAAHADASAAELADALLACRAEGSRDDVALLCTRLD